MSTTDMLEQLGCFVAGVGSGEQALELLARGGSFDLLLTDLGLPGMSGEELAARGARGSSPTLPVVIASGYGRSGRQGEGLQFISKPYSAVDLQQALDHAAGWRLLPEFFAPRATRGGFVAFLWQICSHDGGTAMRTILSKPAPSCRVTADKGPLHGELLDLYMAILIVMPVALFLKSLWS